MHVHNMREDRFQRGERETHEEEVLEKWDCWTHRFQLFLWELFWLLGRAGSWQNFLLLHGSLLSVTFNAHPEKLLNAVLKSGREDHQHSINGPQLIWHTSNQTYKLWSPNVETKLSVSLMLFYWNLIPFSLDMSVYLLQRKHSSSAPTPTPCPPHTKCDHSISARPFQLKGWGNECTKLSAIA